MATGDALLTLGDRDAAMQRFSRALDGPTATGSACVWQSPRIFLRQGRFEDARRQIALGFAEARADTIPRSRQTTSV